MGDVRKHLGSRIKEYRKRIGLQQGQLASILKMDKGTIWRIESGESWPTYDSLIRIAHALNIDEEELLGVQNVEIKETDIPRSLLKVIATANKGEMDLLKNVIADIEEVRSSLPARKYR